MSDKVVRRFLLASDFDQTLSFDDSGLVLSSLLGIPAEEFLRKAHGMAELNLVQQGAELAYLLLHDPQFRSRVHREHLVEAGKLIPLKENIQRLYTLLADGIEGYHFDFFVLSAAPVEIVQSALEGIVPANHIFGTEFKYGPDGEIDTLARTTAGYGKVARLEELQVRLQIAHGHLIYAGDGSSDLHAMLHVNGDDGLTIAVSETRTVARVAKRTVVSANALAMLVPILETVVGWQQPQIREFFEAQGFLVQEWDKVRTDWLTLKPAANGLAAAEAA